MQQWATESWKSPLMTGIPPSVWLSLFQRRKPPKWLPSDFLSLVFQIYALLPLQSHFFPFFSSFFSLRTCNFPPPFFLLFYFRNNGVYYVDDFSTIKPRRGLHGYDESYKYVRVPLHLRRILAKSRPKFRLSDSNQVEVPVGRIINASAALRTSRIDAKRVSSLFVSFAIHDGPYTKFNNSIG